MDNVNLTSNCACSYVHYSDSGNVFVGIFKLWTYIDDNNISTSTSTFFIAHKKNEDELDIEAETIHDWVILFYIALKERRT